MSEMVQSQLIKEKELEEHQFVVFILANKFYGVDVAQVIEITMVPKVTSIPCSPEFIEGIINLRDQVTTIIDLRIRFGLPKKGENDQKRVIIVEKEGSPIGITIDRVVEVLKLPMSSIDDTLDMACDIALEFIKYVVKLSDGTYLNIIDLDRVISTDKVR